MNRTVSQTANMEELATALYGLSRILDDDLEGFAALHAPEGAEELIPAEDQREHEDAAYIRDWIKTHTAN